MKMILSEIVYDFYAMRCDAFKQQKKNNFSTPNTQTKTNLFPMAYKFLSEKPNKHNVLKFKSNLQFS